MPAARYCRLLAVAAGICLTLSACQKVPMLPGLKPYRMDIQQGNVVTQEMVAKLRPGMTRQQVRFVMGTPPIADAFHHDRWDYVYYLNKDGQVVEHRRLILLFDGDTLKRIEGDVVPTADASGRLAGQSADRGGNPGTEATEEKGFFGRMLDKIGF